MSSPFKKTNAIYLLLAVAMLLGILWFQRPTYQGHGKDRWFERYAEDYTLASYTRNLPLSKQQEEAILAFRHFNESGIKYLANKLPEVLEEPPKRTLFIYQILKSVPWNRHRDFRTEKILRDEAAFDLLNHIGIPFDWASKYGSSLVQSSNHTNAFLLDLFLLNACTNQMGKLTNRVIPYLSHSKSFATFKAIQILGKTNIKASAAIPLLVDRPPMRHPAL